MEKSRGVYEGEFSIDPFYLFFLVNTMQVGVGILRAPRILAEDVGNEGWISIIICAILIQLMIALIFYVLRKYEDMDLLQVKSMLFGKILSILISLLIGMYYFLLGVFLLRDFIGVLQDFIFPVTPLPYLFLLFLCPCYLLLRGGISLLVRFSVIVFFSTIWLTVFLVYSYAHFQWEFMLPLFHHSISEHVQAIKHMALDYFGFEIAFFFYPLITRRKQVLLYISLGHWFTTFIYLAIVIGATGLYGSEMLKYQSYPTMDMFRLVQLPFIERVEIIGVSTWGLLVLQSAAGFILIGGKGIQHIWKNSFLCRPHVLTLLAFIALVLMPGRFLDIDQGLSYIGTSWLYLTTAVTLVLVILSFIKRRKGAKA